MSSGQASETNDRPPGLSDGAIQGSVENPGLLARLTPGILLLTFSGFVLLLASNLPTGTPRTPGPGLWPLTVSVVLVLLSALLVGLRDHSGQEVWTHGSVIVVGAIVSLLVFILLFPLIGFTVPAIALSLLWLRVIGRERWVSALLLAVIAPILLFLLFDEVLGVRLPRDLLMSPILGA